MFRIAVICTGNRCRSPLLQAFLGDMTAGLPVEVVSAGTLDLVGEPSPAETLAAARGLGVDLSAHRARHLGSLDLASADLVLGFERDHVAAAVVEGGAAYERTFTLPELVRLLEEVELPRDDDPEQRARQAVAAAHERRRDEDRFLPGEEIEDPIGRAGPFHEVTARRLFELCRRLSELLFGAADS